MNPSRELSGDTSRLPHGRHFGRPVEGLTESRSVRFGREAPGRRGMKKVILGPTGFDVESTGRRACERRSVRFDQTSNPNCEYQRNRRTAGSGIGRRWASCPSSPAASAHGLASHNFPARGWRNLAGWWRRRPPGATVSEASRTYLGQACERRRFERFADPGSIPGGSTGRPTALLHSNSIH